MRVSNAVPISTFEPPARLRVILRGVGGQALPLMIHLVAKRLGRHARSVQTQETRGMAQRGGAVTGVIDAHFQNGSTFRTVLLGLELCEGAQGLTLLHPGDAAFIMRTSIVPPGIWLVRGPSAPVTSQRTVLAPHLNLDRIRGAAVERGITLHLVESDNAGIWSTLRVAIEEGFLPE
jgi:hypothetical protein